jgi:hypothetical protein
MATTPARSHRGAEQRSTQRSRIIAGYEGKSGACRGRQCSRRSEGLLYCLQSGHACGVRIPRHGVVEFGDSPDLVDRIVVPEYVTAVEVVGWKGDATEHSIIRTVQQAVRLLATSPRARTRARRVTFWLGDYRIDGRRFICVNDDIASDVVDCLKLAGDTEGARIQWLGHAMSSDFDLRPIAHYGAGVATAYMPLIVVDGPGQVFSRIATSRSNVHRLLPTRSALPMPASRIPIGPHGYEIWETNNLELIDYFEQREPGPRSLTQLRRVLRAFGIAVSDTDDLPHTLYGKLVAGALGEPTIKVSPHLDDATKHLTIAHELGHYILHWPLVLMGVAIDGEDHDELATLEAEADLAASTVMMSTFWLTSLAALGERTVEKGQPLGATASVWRFFMQAVHPDRPLPGWAELPSLDALAAAATSVRFNDLSKYDLYVRIFAGMRSRLAVRGLG